MFVLWQWQQLDPFHYSGISSLREKRRGGKTASQTFLFIYFAFLPACSEFTFFLIAVCHGVKRQIRKTVKRRRRDPARAPQRSSARRSAPVRPVSGRRHNSAVYLPRGFLIKSLFFDWRSLCCLNDVVSLLWHRRQPDTGRHRSRSGLYNGAKLRLSDASSANCSHASILRRSPFTFF